MVLALEHLHGLGIIHRYTGTSRLFAMRVMNEWIGGLTYYASFVCEQRLEA